MRQRLVRIESRNAGVVFTASDRALSVRFPMLMSLAQDGTSPQRMVVKCRLFLPCSFRTVMTGCVGAMLYRGRSSISSSADPKRSVRYCFECVSRYLLHTTYCRRFDELSRMDLTPEFMMKVLSKPWKTNCCWSAQNHFTRRGYELHATEPAPSS